VLKHIPGHGRARSDSHEDLPVVTESLEVLEQSDFMPFQRLAHLPLGMTAHILYTAIDDKIPATLSPKVIAFVRKEIGFDGLLMSDDVSMKALKGSLKEISSQSLTAGCDVVLHCNGKMEEMRQVAEGLLALEDIAERRFERALAKLTPPKKFDQALAKKLVDGA
jgi:beta-N-acetylhexosaminidase